MIKQCKKCGKEQTLAHFYRNRAKRDGYDEYCKQCRRTYQNHRNKTDLRTRIKKRSYARWYYQTHQAKMRLQMKTWHTTHSTDAVQIEKRRTRQKAYNLRKRYQLDATTYEQLRIQQKDSCAICGDYRRKLVIDHDHKTHQVRGLLCSRCNMALGQFGDEISLLRAAIRYLGRPKIVPISGTSM